MGAVLFIVISVTFFISHMLPGDPLLLWAGERPTEEQLDLARENLGLDQPKTKQFYIFLRNIIRGDMGTSLRTRQPVIKEIGVRFASTLELVSFSMFFALFVGALLGLVSVLKKGTKIDSFIRVAGYVGMSFPVFWLGMVLQIVFFGLLGWLPLQGRLSGQFLPELNTGFVFIDCLCLPLDFPKSFWCCFLTFLGFHCFSVVFLCCFFVFIGFPGPFKPLVSYLPDLMAVA